MNVDTRSLFIIILSYHRYIFLCYLTKYSVVWWSVILKSRCISHILILSEHVAKVSNYAFRIFSSRELRRLIRFLIFCIKLSFTGGMASIVLTLMIFTVVACFWRLLVQATVWVVRNSQWSTYCAFVRLDQMGHSAWLRWIPSGRKRSDVAWGILGCLMMNWLLNAWPSCLVNSSTLFM